MTRNKPFDGSVYLVTDRGLARGRPLEQVVEAAVRGGVTAVQLREKEATTREYVALARRLLEVLRPVGVPLLIDDRVDVALAAGADGVHVGQSDMRYEDARRLLGPGALIGLTVEDDGQAREADSLDADYLGVSPIFATPTKTDTGPPWGLDGLRRLRSASSHRLIAIGGVHPGNATEVVRAGADGVAVVSAICAADDPEQAARSLLRAVRAARQPDGGTE
jgi:thiamine-phosphate pyrophosphorylase